MPNALITGIPRSGTSLAAALVDSCRNAICLSEPVHHVALMQGAANAGDFVAALSRDFEIMRRRLRDGGTILDRRAPDGGSTTDYFAARGNERRTDVSRLMERRKVGLGPDFLLAVKHNALFAAALHELAGSGQFALIAIIRDPAHTIASWRSLRLPVSSGRLPAAEKFWPEMAKICTADTDLLDKQIFIYDCFCRRYHALAPLLRVVRYEEFAANYCRLIEPLDLRPEGIQPPMRGAAQALPTAGEIAERIGALGQRSLIPGLVHYYPRYAA
jgi:hypothetical protein